ncbi:5'-3' exonuclease [Microbacterium horticulturae]|uniref:5'-3' exonuclease n=1 Tax=Microbacterium horticulturae TaxID=3028316 RepID=A0ABY8C1A8_9MICO|nr:5'-3' exonuclease [Microbacterium sp. KACC 23027]WEG10189.1 5'-3' exonuclease [Microbacterium sp. KACC 23027]
MVAPLMLLDSASLYFRGFYGAPASITAPDGTPVNAVRGFLDIIAKLVATYRPGPVVACWDDAWRPRWRVGLIASYKAHRVAQTLSDGTWAEDVPPELIVQVPIIREVLEALGMPPVGAADHEADDVIGTLAARATGPVDVVTGDRDLFQVIDDDRGVRVVYTARGMSRLEVVTDEVVQTKYGVHAGQYVDFAVLRGDPSDGLPGVAGIGEKTAAGLLAAHGDLAGIRAAADAGEGLTPRARTNVLASAAYLDVAPTVVRVTTDADVPPAPARAPRPDLDAAHALAERWGLGGAMQRVLDALAG